MSWNTVKENIIDVVAEFPFEKHYSYGHVKTSDDGRDIILTNNYGVSTTFRLELGEMGEPNYTRTSSRGWNIFLPYALDKDDENNYISDLRNHIHSHYAEMFKDNCVFLINNGGSCYAPQFWDYQDNE